MTELPSQEVLKNQIAAINDSLQALAEKATLQFQPFDEFDIPDKFRNEVEITEIKDVANSVGFWKHYIGGSIALVDQEMQYAKFKGLPVDTTVIDKLQARTIQDTRLRLSSLVEGNVGDLLDRASCEVYLRVSGVFDWSNAEARNQGLFRELYKAVINLGDSYMMLSGKRPL